MKNDKGVLLRTVEVWGTRCELSLHQDPNTLWVATGTYEGHRIETKDKSESAVLKRWQEMARKKGP